MALTLELTHAQKNQLRIDALDVKTGTQSHKDIKCPLCGQEDSFSVKRDSGGLLYKCFRVKCGVEGYIATKVSTSVLSGVKDNPTPNKDTKKVFISNRFSGSLEKMPRRIKNFLIAKYQINGRESKYYGFSYHRTSRRIHMPVYNLWGMVTGSVLKKTPESTWGGPKTMNYWEVDDPIRLHFPKSTTAFSSTIVVVEDILSASKLSPLIRSCALLGSSMSTTQAAFLATHFDKMVVLLDPDAIDAAAKISKKFGGMFKHGVTVRVLDQDPKDTQLDVLEKEVKAFLPKPPLVEKEKDNPPNPVGDPYCGC